MLSPEPAIAELMFRTLSLMSDMEYVPQEPLRPTHGLRLALNVEAGTRRTAAIEARKIVRIARLLANAALRAARRMRAVSRVCAGLAEPEGRLQGGQVSSRCAPTVPA